MIEEKGKYVIRKSVIGDEATIKELIKLSFGARGEHVYSNLTGRYWLCFDGDKVIGMTGLTCDTKYRGLEVDWTCTHPEYRHQGVMQMLFRKMLCGVVEPVYCSCWRLPGKDRVNLQTVMDIFDFHLVVPERFHHIGEYTCRCFKDCIHSGDKHCECWEDLYLRALRTPGKS